MHIAATIFAFILFFAAIFIPLNWLNKYKLGKDALKDARRKDNFLPLWAPFVVFLLWVILMQATAKVLEIYFGFDCCDEDLPKSQISLAVSSVITSIISLYLANEYFPGGLRYFGLSRRTIAADLKRAAVVLVKVFPIVWAVMMGVSILAQLVKVQVPPHPLIEYATTAGYWQQGLVVLLAVVVAPVLEEILFRGFVQTKLNDNLHNRWFAILLASAFFATVHGGALWTHWLSLFVFSCALGYVYEKSGSLWQSIFLHSMFNALNIFLALFVVKAQG